MDRFKPTGIALSIAPLLYCLGITASAAQGWREDTFPPPNGGRLVFTITSNGTPACASYDGANCLWGLTTRDIDFRRVRPLVCGAAHRKVHGVTGFENPNHWCNLALRGATAQTAPSAPKPPPPQVTLTNQQCIDYAKSALNDYEQAIKFGQCAVRIKSQPPGRWTNQFRHHYDWCVTVQQAARYSEIKQRDNLLIGCGARSRL